MSDTQQQITEAEKIANLQIIRFLVIEDYPLSPFPVGRILELSLHYVFGDISECPSLEWQLFFADKEGSEIKYNIAFFLKYPIHFKQLQWWEKRHIDDMPEYVKWNCPHIPEHGDVIKVEQWGLYKEMMVVEFTKPVDIIGAKFFLPSTMKEFLEQKNDKKCRTK